jgi:hypothetical protein
LIALCPTSLVSLLSLSLAAALRPHAAHSSNKHVPTMASRSALLRPAFASPAASCSTSSTTAGASRSAQLAALQRRNFALSPARQASASRDEADKSSGSKSKSSFKTWLNVKNDTLRAWFRSEEGERFKWTKEGAHNWIGGDRVRERHGSRL